LVKFYTFNGNLFNCEEDEAQVGKNEIIVEIIDVETGEVITDDYEMEILVDDEDNILDKCPSDCSVNKREECLCEDLSLFAVDS